MQLETLFVAICPGGWWDDNKCRIAEIFSQSLTAVNPQSRLVFPKVDFDLQHGVDQARTKWDANAPWKILANVGVGPITHAARRYADAQVWVDEARIACALERYRLAHGVYPGSLDALVPACIDELPHDIMNGAPYHYQLRPDGAFALYSVGWNQIDDCGKVVYKTDSPKQIDYERGDLAWPTPK
jgi:hypothetical protein